MILTILPSVYVMTPNMAESKRNSNVRVSSKVSILGNVEVAVIKDHIEQKVFFGTLETVQTFWGWGGG